MSRPVVVIGCGKAKLGCPAPAADLYTGSLFRASLAWARENGSRVYIASALHGLVRPSDWLEPYDYTLLGKGRVERDAWGARVVEALQTEMRQTHYRVTLLMGEVYADAIAAHLPRQRVTEPLRGLALGQRLGWFKQQRGAA